MEKPLFAGEQNRASCRAVLDGCEFQHFDDVDDPRVSDWLADRRRGHRPEVAPVLGTARSYAEIARAFGVAERTVSYWRRRGAPIRPRRPCDLGAIARWRREHATSTRMSSRTSNGYLGVLKSFFNWGVNKKRFPHNPVQSLDRLNESLDRRYIRRALTPEEFSALVEATRTGPSFHGLSGPDRAVLYLVSGFTGLRRGDLKRLKARDFDLE
ncbi:MAG: hypothetical protein JXQ29_08450, partial [Planctomycetes bacterium]|nr:hypothetical protein [Planctomycetota bacterium]